MKPVSKTYKRMSATLFAMILAIATLFALCGCSLFDPEVDSPSASASKKLELSNLNMTYSYSEYLGYSVKITGTAKNIGGRNYSYASVEFTVYGESGSNLGTALDNINHLGKGDIWNFEATLFSFPKEKPATYKLVEITAW